MLQNPGGWGNRGREMEVGVERGGEGIGRREKREDRGMREERRKERREVYNAERNGHKRKKRKIIITANLAYLFSLTFAT